MNNSSMTNSAIMSSASSAVTQASGTYDMCNSLIDELQAQNSSLSDVNFMIGKDSKINDNNTKIQAAMSTRTQMSMSAMSAINMYKRASADVNAYSLGASLGKTVGQPTSSQASAFARLAQPESSSSWKPLQ